MGLGYLERGEHDAYTLGYRLFELGSRVDHSGALSRRFQPFLAGLASLLNETVHLGVLRGTSVAYVATVEGGRASATTLKARTPIDAHGSGTGKVLLAFMPEESVRQLYAGRRLEARTARTITNLEMLIRVLGQIRVQRYGFDIGELDNGLRCVAAPIFDASGNARCAISVSGPASRLTDLALPNIIAAVSSAAAAASTAFTGTVAQAVSPSAVPSVEEDTPDEMETLFDR